MLNAFALRDQSPPRARRPIPGLPATSPTVAAARQRRRRDRQGREHELRKLAPDAGSYVAESSYFERDWQRVILGPELARLLAVKDRYDPEGLFFVHHGVGSEQWSADGFL